MTVHPEVDTHAPSGLDHHVRAGGPNRLAEAHSQSRRGIHETTPLWFCCDRRNGARCYRCWKRDLRRGLSVVGPRGPVWYMSTGLLARPWKAGVLDTARRAGPVWRVPAKLSPRATTGRVLGGFCRLGHNTESTMCRRGAASTRRLATVGYRPAPPDLNFRSRTAFSRGISRLAWAPPV